ncbi:MAG TPA: serine/threonine-protein kinase [Pyrinomonadaceae bacterium]|nr:serine/threonine-protein kinase [Pyrinomonadaceae bacterium]
MLQCPQCGREYFTDLKECPEDGALLRADQTVAGQTVTDPLVGRVLDDKYQLDERLGEGGMGTVYRATHLLIDRPVAVKVLNAKLVTDGAAKERFRREARAAGRLQHSNAVAVTDFGETSDGLVYIVMELLEGTPLRNVLATEAPLDPARAVSLMLQIAAAVAAAHEAGIIHRDLKPGNIFIVQRPHAPHIVKVLDFGIAKLATDTSDGQVVNTLTGTGVMIGTPRYMSPEQCDGAPLSPASDVYSLGVILYEMLTGQTPFTGATPLALALKHSAEQPRRPRELVASVPVALEEVVLHALAKKPEERPEDARAFRRELYAVAERLGLEHAAGFSAPTLETLRDAGTETPSGRLVIDIERLRQSRATAPMTREASAAPDTAQDLAAQTGGRLNAHAASAPEADAAHAAEAGSDASAEASSASPEVDSSGRPIRVHVPIRRGASRSLLSRPQVQLVAAALAAVAVVVMVVLLLRWRDGDGGGARSSSDPAASAQGNASGEAVGRNLGAAEPTRGRSPVTEPRSAAEFYERGNYNFSSRDFERAIADYRRAIELQPEFPSAHNRLGWVLMMKGQVGEAEREFREAIRQSDGNFAAAQYNLGFALQQQGKLEDAIGAYQEAVRSRGGSYADAYFQIGLAYIGLKRNAEAADALRTAVEQNGGRDPEARHALGVALAQQNDLEGAEAAFRSAIEERGGDYAEAHYNLGLLYQKTGRVGEAIDEFEAYLRQRPKGENRRQVENSLRDLRRQAAREGAQQQQQQQQQ